MTAAAYLGIGDSVLEARRAQLWAGVRKPPAKVTSAPPSRGGPPQPSRSRAGGSRTMSGPPPPESACYDAPIHSHSRRTTRVSTDKALAVGVGRPDFTLKEIGLKEVSLRSLRGKNVVLLFYPLDWTPG